MAIVYNSNQVKWGDRGYLDAKMQPVANVAALPSDPTEVFEGMTVVVLDDGSGKPCDYWRVNGAWVKKESGSEGIAQVQEELDALSDKLGDDFTSANTVSDAIASVNSALAGKVDAVAGKGLSSNDFSDEEKSKLEGIEPGAQANVKSDWNAVDGDAEILNKPDLSIYAKSTDLDALATKAEIEAMKQDIVDEAIDAAADYVDDLHFVTESALTTTLGDYAKGSDVENALSAATAYTDQTFDSVSGEIIDLNTNLETEKAARISGEDTLRNEISSAKTEAVSEALAAVEAEGYAKAAEVQDAFDNVGTAMTATYEAAVSAATDAAKDAVAGEGYMKEADVLSAITNAVETKQDELEEGDGIAIENNTIGVLYDDVTIKLNNAGKLYAVGGGEGGGSYSPGQYIAIENSVISVTGITPDEYATKAELSAETESRTNADEALVSEIEVLGGRLDDEVSARTSADEALSADIAEAKQEAVAEAVSAATDNMVDYVDARAEQIVSAATAAAVAEVEDQDYMKEDDVLSAITSAVEAKQDKLEAGENITIEGNVISANVDLSDYALSSAVTAEIAAAKDEAVAEAVALVEAEDYATKADVLSAQTDAVQEAKEYVDGQDFATNAQVADAVSAATKDSVSMDDLDEAVSAATAGLVSQTDLEEAKAAATADAVDEIDARNYVDDEYVASAETAIKEWVNEQGFLTEHQDISGKMDVFEAGQALELAEGKLNVLVDDATIKVNPETGKLYAIGGGEGGGSYSPGQYIKIEGNVISVSGITPDEYATKAEVASAQTDAVAEAKQYVDTQDFAKADDVQNALDEMVDNVNTAITASQEAAVAEAKEYVDGQEFVKPEDVASAVTAAVEAGNYVNEADMNSAITSAVESKQDKLEAGENIKIEGNVISATFNADLDDYATKDELNSAATDTLQAAKDYVDGQEFAQRADLENVVEDVATAITASHEAAVDEAKQYVDDQKFVKPEDVASAVTAAVEAGHYMNEDDVNSAITSAVSTKQDKLEAGENIKIEGNVISAVFEGDLDDYATKESVENLAADVVTAITASHEAAVEEAKEYVDGQEFAKAEDVASAVTSAIEAGEYVNEADMNSAITSALETKQDKLTAGDNIAISNENVISVVGLDFSEYATLDDLNSATTQAVEAAKDYVDEQGFAKDDDVAEAISAATANLVTVEDLEDAIAESASAATEEFVSRDELADAITAATADMATTSDVEDAIDEAVSAATAAVAQEGYAKEQDVEDAITSANTYTDNAIAGITHPEYTLVSSASQQYSAVYDLKKDNAVIANSAQIRIPKGAQLENELVTDVAVGHVSAGTVFNAGTSIESILRQIFTSGTPGGDTLYAYYGGIVEPLDEPDGLTEANIKANCTRSASAAAEGEITFRVNAGCWQLLIAVPSTLIVDEIKDNVNNIDYTQEVTNDYEPKGTTTIDGATYNLYYKTFGASFASRVTFKMTLINA